MQGFLTKLGLTRSYVCVNAWAYAVHPSQAQAEQQHLDEPDELAWRNELYDRITGPELQAVVAFGAMAQRAVELWDSHPDVPVKRVPHPSSRDPDKLLNAWRAAVEDLRGVVTPDSDGDNTGPNYGDQVQGGRPRRDPAARSPVRRPRLPGRRLRGARGTAARAPSRARCPMTGTR